MNGPYFPPTDHPAPNAGQANSSAYIDQDDEIEIIDTSLSY